MPRTPAVSVTRPCAGLAAHQHAQVGFAVLGPGIGDAHVVDTHEARTPRRASATGTTGPAARRSSPRRRAAGSRPWARRTWARAYTSTLGFCTMADNSAALAPDASRRPRSGCIGMPRITILLTTRPQDRRTPFAAPAATRSRRPAPGRRDRAGAGARRDRSPRRHRRSRRRRTPAARCRRPAGARRTRPAAVRACARSRIAAARAAASLSPCHTSTIRSFSASCSQLLRSTTPSSITASLPAYRKRRRRRWYSRRRRAAGLVVELHVRHEAQARDRQPAILGRIVFRQEIAVADRAPALHARVQATQAEDQADEADAGEDVEEEPEEREADEGRTQQRQVRRDEDRVDVGGRLAAVEGECGQRDQQRRDDVLEPGRRRTNRAAGDQRFGGLGHDLDARHDRIDRRGLGVVESGRGVADQHHAILQCGWRGRRIAADGLAAGQQVGRADARQAGVLSPVRPHRGGNSRVSIAGVAVIARRRRQRGQGPVADRLAQRNVAQDAVLHCG